MNELIETILSSFKVNGKSIAYQFLNYTGNETTYITYGFTNIGETFYGDDELQAYVDYYDFDIYSKGNYFGIVEGLKEVLKANGFVWQPTMTSEDIYENDTGYYHKTLCFSYLRNEEELNNG